MTAPDSANFLGIPDEDARYEAARGVVVPVPWEATVSYGAGTANRGAPSLFGVVFRVKYPGLQGRKAVWTRHSHQGQNAM